MKRRLAEKKLIIEPLNLYDHICTRLHFLLLSANYSTYLLCQRLCSHLMALWHYIKFRIIIIIIIIIIINKQ